MKAYLFTTSLILIFSSVLSAKVDEEELLRRKANLLAKKIHVRNMNLIGIDPKTCKPIEDGKLIVNQIGQIKNGKLDHCPELIKDKLKAIDEELKNVQAGVLVYKPIPIPPPTLPVANLPTYKNEEPNDPSESKTESYDTPEETVPTTEVVDHTGLTEEQKMELLIGYERNKNRFNATEDDDLFSILSKAYVRNLDKVFAIKKKLD